MSLCLTKKKNREVGNPRNYRFKHQLQLSYSNLLYGNYWFLVVKPNAHCQNPVVTVQEDPVITGSSMTTAPGRSTMPVGPRPACGTWSIVLFRWKNLRVKNTQY